MKFVDHVYEAAGHRRLALPAPGHPEPLAHLDYRDERAVKADAVRSFWRAHALPGAAPELVPTPAPRGYRSTTKRRAALRRDGLVLSFPGAPAAERVAASSATLR